MRSAEEAPTLTFDCDGGGVEVDEEEEIPPVVPEIDGPVRRLGESPLLLLLLLLDPLFALNIPVVVPRGLEEDVPAVKL